MTDLPARILAAPVCNVADCDTGGKLTRGMCGRHYRYWLDHTPPEDRPPLARETKTIWDHVDKSGDCWLWQGATNRRGYGTWCKDGKPALVHRVALAEVEEPAGPGLWALHHCDNPPCVNPAHLYWGTHEDNMRDAAERDRIHNKGVFADVCKWGHPRSGENLAFRGKDKKRVCRECERQRRRECDRKRYWLRKGAVLDESA